MSGEVVLSMTELAGTLRFAEAERPCSYWSDGLHIVAGGVCRCGRSFVVVEKVEAWRCGTS